MRNFIHRIGARPISLSLEIFVDLRHYSCVVVHGPAFGIVLACLLTISLTAFFARQNRKQGWNKPRVFLIDRLRETKRSLLRTDEDEAHFSHALQRLQTALHRANEPVPVGAGFTTPAELDREQRSSCV